jgi:hypothetical protein
VRCQQYPEIEGGDQQVDDRIRVSDLWEGAGRDRVVEKSAGHTTAGLNPPQAEPFGEFCIALGPSYERPEDSRHSRVCEESGEFADVQLQRIQRGSVLGHLQRGRGRAQEGVEEKVIQVGPPAIDGTLAHPGAMRDRVTRCCRETTG